MNVREATIQDRNTWNSYVLGSVHASFFQTWEWGDVQQKIGLDVWRYVVESDRGQVLACAFVLRRPLPLGKSWLYVPRGPVMDASEGETWRALVNTLSDLAREHDAIFVRFDPKWEDTPGFLSDRSRGAQSFVKADREVQPRHTLLLDLTATEDDLLAAMKSKTRYNVRLARRKGVRVRFSTDDDDVRIFLDLSREVHERSGFQFHPDAYYEAILSVLGGGNNVAAELAIAEYEGTALAAHLMVYAGSIASYTHGASTSEKRELQAPTALYWETIRRAKERGCTTYDFFGVAPDGADEHHPWSGVTRMKNGFGGRRVSYIGAYDLVLEPFLYRVFNVARSARDTLRHR